MKKFMTIMALIVSAQTFSYDLIQLPFHVISGNNHRNWNSIQWISEQVSEGDHPLTVFFGALFSPLFLLNEETGQMEASVEALLEQGYTVAEIDETQTAFDHYVMDNQGREFSSKEEFVLSLKTGIQSQVALEILGIN